MDFFKFTDPVQTNFVNGQGFRGYETAMWVERYREPGEFEFTAKLSSGLRELLPTGTVISHTESLDVGIVEDHEIEESNDEDSTIRITGRMFPSYLENRIVGVNQAFGSPPAPFTEYTLASASSDDQIVQLINDHILASFTADDDDALDGNLQAVSSIATSLTSADRLIKRGPLWTRVAELLAIDDLGIRTIRRNPFGSLGSDLHSYFLIHKGLDRSADVVFSVNMGDLERAKYLWSNRKMKNAALVQGRYTEVLVVGTETGYDRRTMLVDAQDLDGALSAPPSGATLTNIRARMTVRGQEALAAQKVVDIVDTDISNTTRYQYRKDYDIGDIVSIQGTYGDIEKRRVIEYVEVEDENGQSGHPTLEVVGG